MSASDEQSPPTGSPPAPSPLSAPGGDAPRLSDLLDDVTVGSSSGAPGIPGTPLFQQPAPVEAPRPTIYPATGSWSPPYAANSNRSSQPPPEVTGGFGERTFPAAVPPVPVPPTPAPPVAPLPATPASPPPPVAAIPVAPSAPAVPAPIQPAAAPSPPPEPPAPTPAVENRPGYGPDTYSGAQGYRGSNFGGQEYAAHTYNSFPSAAAAALAQSAGNTTPEPVTPPPAKAPLPSWAPVSVHVPPRNPTAPKDSVKEPVSAPAPVPPPPAAPVVAASSHTPFAVVPPPPSDAPGLMELPPMPSPAQNPGANILPSPPGETLAAPAETPPAPDWSAEEQESPFVNTAGAGAALASAAAETDRAQYAINLKGRADGLVLEVGKGSWAEILGALADKLDTSGTFFRHGKVVVDLGPRPVLEEELRQLVQMLTRQEMRVTLLRTTSERSLQTALAMGISATLETAEGVPVVDAMPAESNLGSSYFVYRGYLRSGHKLFRKETILVIGDVNPGAEVISHGDVLVWGRLRGIVHAGAAGNHRAIVAALDLDPTQLRIASTLAVGADATVGVSGKWLWKRSKNKRPEIARLSNREIAVEEWDVTRPGGIVSLRRGGR